MESSQVAATLEELGQEHLFAKWSDGGDKARFFEQMAQLDASYPGGLKAYVANARQLLSDSKSGVNPLEGWAPNVPTGTSLRFASADYLEHEQVGVQELDGCSFVLVAGGLGERRGSMPFDDHRSQPYASWADYPGPCLRYAFGTSSWTAQSPMGADSALPSAAPRLGFSGIKVALPYQISTGECYLQLYIGSILALQRRAAEATGRAVELPLAIMVSEDTLAGATHCDTWYAQRMKVS